MKCLLYAFIYFSALIFFNINDSYGKFCIEGAVAYIPVSEIKSTSSGHFIRNITNHKGDVIKGSTFFEYNKHIRRISPKFAFDHYLSLSFGKTNQYENATLSCIRKYGVNTLCPIVVLRKLRI